MGKNKEQEVWELAVGKANNSLEKEETEEIQKLEDSTKAQKYLNQASRIHSKLRNGFLIKKIDKEKNWKYISKQINDKVSIRKISIQISKYAAVFILALLIGITITKKIPEYKSDISYNVIEIDWGQMSKMTLSDGTKVWLNAGTKLEYPTVFNSKERRIKLNGEAQFKVTHNKDIPFEVETMSGIIKVYGTTFNASSYDDDPEFVVTLIEGKVTIEDNKNHHLTTLNPSQQVIINKETGEAKLREVNTSFYSSWIDGKILLDETKLSDLTKILKRWYNVDIKLVGEDIGNIKISGTVLKGKPLDLFLKILERMYGIKYELKTNRNEKDKVIIYKN